MRILAVLLVLPLTSLAQGMLIVPADDVARSVVDGMIEPLSKSGLAFKTAGGRAPAMACFKEQEATRQHACLLRIASDANVLGVLLVRGASAKRVVDASFEVLEVASQGATFREKLRSPEPKLARATAMLLKRLLPALLHLKPALPPPPPPADPPGDPAPLARNDPGPPPATATPRPPPPPPGGAGGGGRGAPPTAGAASPSVLG
jgi:hypothetical protein